MTGVPSATDLFEVIAEAQTLGFLGPGPIDAHLRHASGYVSIARSELGTAAAGARLLDLGSGGGLPGLVVASEWPEVSLTLLDANGRRTSFLRRAVARLGISDQVSVVEGRAETAGRSPELRGMFDMVLSRSFGRPAVTAECAAPFLRPGGWLVVSEPPRDGSSGSSEGGQDERPARTTRWPAGPLGELGLEPLRAVQAEFGYQVLRQVAACPDRYARRDGVPARKPLF